MALATPLADTLARLRQGPAGRALYTRVQAVDGRWETVWLIRDASQRLETLGPAPAVEFRAGAFDEGGVMVLPILVRLGPEEAGYIYDTCINAYQIEGENIYLQDLARQDRIHIHLYDDAGELVHTLTAPNRLRELAQTVLERQSAYQPSTTAAFEYSRERLYANYADIWALWHTLERG
jgi:hypothetical protein